MDDLCQRMGCLMWPMPFVSPSGEWPNSTSEEVEIISRHRELRLQHNREEGLARKIFRGDLLNIEIYNIYIALFCRSFSKINQNVSLTLPAIKIYALYVKKPMLRFICLNFIIYVRSHSPISLSNVCGFLMSSLLTYKLFLWVLRPETHHNQEVVFIDIVEVSFSAEIRCLYTVMGLGQSVIFEVESDLKQHTTHWLKKF